MALLLRLRSLAQLAAPARVRRRLTTHTAPPAQASAVKVVFIPKAKGAGLEADHPGAVLAQLREAVGPDAASALSPLALDDVCALGAKKPPRESIVVHSQAQRVLAVGLGSALSEATAATWRAAAAKAVRGLETMKAAGATVQLHLPSLDPAAVPEASAAIAHGVHLAHYKFDRHLTKEKEEEEEGERRLNPDHLELVIQPPAQDQPAPPGSTAAAAAEAAAAAVGRAKAVSQGTLLARDLANERAAAMGPEALEAAAREVADKSNGLLRCRVLHEAELVEEGLNMLVAVGQAAEEKARLVLLEMGTDEVTTEPGQTLVVVGKGVTFDTGGLNLKPTGFIETMHMDMGGAAAVLGAAAAMSELRAGGGGGAGERAEYSRVVFALAVAENAIGARAYKPHAILKSHSGLTVEVGNTDAEGRLCLADAMSWTQQHFKPAALLDLATLTGACVVALGEYSAGVFRREGAASAALVGAVTGAGAKWGERFDPLPVYDEHREELKADQADLSSTGAGRYGGACTAAAFLEKFVEGETAWAHLDIAGPAMISKARGHLPKGGTGFGAATLAEFIDARLR